MVDNRVVAKLIESIIFIIDSVLPLIRKPPLGVIEELEQDLKHMIVRHSFLTVVHACIRCLCSLCKIAGKGATLVEYLIQVFYKRLDGLGAEHKQQAGRSLFCLGLLIRYGNELMVTSNQNLHALRSVSLLKKYLLDEDFGIKVRSLQALGFVLIARPEYMLEKDIGKILEATLSSDCDARLKMQSLQNLYEYLLDTESQMGTENASSNAVNNYPEGAGHKVPVAAGAGDTNICGGIIQLYWNNILARCLDATNQVRQSALKIVEVVLRQGLVHPITAVPFLIALETDPQEVNSKLAHHLLMNMNDKYPAFFESRLGDGLQMSFVFIQSLGIESSNHKKPGNLKGKSDSSVFAYSRLGISRIYRLIRGNRNSRNKFMSSVIRKFDSGSLNQPSIPFLIYCTEVLASLPFTLPDEPLYLIYTINRVIQVRAGALESEMKYLSSHYTQGDTAKVAQENGLIPDSILYNYGDNNDTEAMKMHKSNFTDSSCISIDLQKFQDACHAAISLQLLLKVKRHLKIVYSLNDARCQAFSPNEPVKPGETLSRQSIPFNINDTPVVLPTSYEEMIEKYQDFKASLKDDTIDYSVYTANIKRKRPPARSSRGGKSARETGDEEEDDYEDGEWNPAYQRLNGSGHKSSGGRRTRQRL